MNLWVLLAWLYGIGAALLTLSCVTTLARFTKIQRPRPENIESATVSIDKEYYELLRELHLHQRMAELNDAKSRVWWPTKNADLRKLLNEWDAGTRAAKKGD